jgi:hypothetical protein
MLSAPFAPLIKFDRQLGRWISAVSEILVNPIGLGAFELLGPIATLSRLAS